MAGRILIESRPKETRAALMEDRALVEIRLEREKADMLTGNIYMGRVEKLLPGMQAAFINIGLDKNAFLSLTDLPQAAGAIMDGAQNARPVKRLKVGEELPVQITKLPGGTKGPRVLADLSLAGRLAVLLPSVPTIGVSKKIEDEEEKQRLRGIARRLAPEGMGLIIRTNAQDAVEAEIEEDVGKLVKEYEALARRASCVKAPCLLRRDGDLVSRCVRDTLNGDISEMLIEDEGQYLSALETAKTYAPEFADRIRHYKSELSLFAAYGVNKQLETALSRRVWLKSGGYLIFDRTEAFTVIDVNTGKFAGGSKRTDTILKINLEAAEEIARQLRLRDIGGIVVVDFIDMASDADREALVNALKVFVKADKTRTTVMGLTKLGLVEISRKREREPIETYFKAPCPLCAGEGHITHPDAVAFDAFGALERRFRANPAQPLLLLAAARVIDSILRLNPRLSGRAYCAPDAGLPGHEFVIQEIQENSLPPKSRRITGEDQHE